MAITVARGVKTRIREDTGNFVIQVQDAPDPVAATRALDKARRDIASLDGGWQSVGGLTPQDRNDVKFISQVLPAGTGPFILVDGGYCPDELLATIPDLVAGRLEEEGVTEAVIASPKGGGELTGLSDVPRAVVLRLYPPPPPVRQYQREWAEIPPGWIQEACAWVQGALEDAVEIRAEVNNIEFPLPVGQAAGFLEQCRAARADSCMLLAGDLGTSVRATAGYLFVCEPNLALAGGGPGASDADLMAVFDGFVEIARRLAPELGYACVRVEHSFIAFSISRLVTELSSYGGPQPGGMYDLLMDEIVYDAFPFQVLGPGHLERLGGAPPGARELPGGRVELAIGDPSSWLIDGTPGPSPYVGLGSRRRDPTVQEAGRQVLAPCLVTEDEIRALLRGRIERTQQTKPPST